MATFREWLQRGWADIKTYARQGLREARNALYPETPVARDLDPGMWGSALQREIYDARHAGLPEKPAPTAESARESVVDSHVHTAAAEREACGGERTNDAARTSQREAMELDK